MPIKKVGRIIKKLNRRQLVLLGVVVILGVVGIVQVIKTQIKRLPNEKKIKVVTTLYPLYDFIKNIGGERVEITLLVPPGVEPHNFEPKPRDMITLNQADLFVYTGPLMETWVEDTLKGLNNKKLVVVNVSKKINLMPAMYHDSNEKQILDPHIWLSITNVQTIGNEIAKGLIQVDNKNSAYYKKSAQKYQMKIVALENEYVSGLRVCKKRTIVYAGHYTFGYLAKEFTLAYLAAQGISSDAEPTVFDLSRLVETVKKEKISDIFYQELSSPKVAEIITQETGARMLLLNSVHTVSKQDFERGVSFIEIMKDNLHTLRKGLGCK